MRHRFKELEKVKLVQSIQKCTFNSSFKSAFNLIAKCIRNIHKLIEWSTKHQKQQID